MTQTLSPVLPDEVDAAAQRCTGALLASLFTDVEDASRTFERGFVVYANAARAEMLSEAV